MLVKVAKVSHMDPYSLAKELLFSSGIGRLYTMYQKVWIKKIFLFMRGVL